MESTRLLRELGNELGLRRYRCGDRRLSRPCSNHIHPFFMLPPADGARLLPPSEYPRRESLLQRTCKL